MKPFGLPATVITAGLWVLVLLLVGALPQCRTQEAEATTRSFTIDFRKNCFLKDGEPFRYVSGSLHYFRVPVQYWLDRMTKMRAAGLNALQTYIEWNQHEPSPGNFDFTGNNDIIRFIKTAQVADLLVILRPGPFIDAERDMGGLPYWLMSFKNTMKLRTSDPDFLRYVNRYYSKLLPMIEPYLYKNGGPIISIQVENEYGSYSACDFAYTAHLKKLIRSYLGNEVLLFTTDGAGDGYLKCGKIDQIYTTVDFGSGSNVTDAFFRQRLHQSTGPLVNSEFYPGWLDHWGEKHANVGKQAVAKALDTILSFNASVNIYMFHGGTSFNFSNGANIDGGVYAPCPTSYDYDAPLSEAGDPTPKYFAIQDVIRKYLPLPDMPLPVPSPKMEVGPVHLSYITDLFIIAEEHQTEQVTSLYPLTFEELYQAYGFVLYSTMVPFQPYDPEVLEISGLADRGYIFINKELRGILVRNQITKMPLLLAEGDDLSILVENQGRVSVGDGIKDFKGIIGNVTLGGKILTNWTISQFFPNWTEAVRNLTQGEFTIKNSKHTSIPAFYMGSFTLKNTIKTPRDTFLRLDGWHKGVAILNEHILGRYWPIQGPQETLYAPAPYFKPFPAKNQLILLELENAPCHPKPGGSRCSVKFVKHHVVNGPVPYDS